MRKSRDYLKRVKKRMNIIMGLQPTIGHGLSNHTPLNSTLVNSYPVTANHPSNIINIICSTKPEGVLSSICEYSTSTQKHVCPKRHRSVAIMLFSLFNLWGTEVIASKFNLSLYVSKKSVLYRLSLLARGLITAAE